MDDDLEWRRELYPDWDRDWFVDFANAVLDGAERAAELSVARQLALTMFVLGARDAVQFQTGGNDTCRPGEVMDVLTRRLGLPDDAGALVSNLRATSVPIQWPSPMADRRRQLAEMHDAGTLAYVALTAEVWPQPAHIRAYLKECSDAGFDDYSDWMVDPAGFTPRRLWGVLSAAEARMRGGGESKPGRAPDMGPEGVAE